MYCVAGARHCISVLLLLVPPPCLQGLA